MFRNILVPLDGSALAEEILPRVKELAKLTGAKITLLSVVYAHTSADKFHGEDTSVRQVEAKEAAEKYLDGLKQSLTGEGFSVDTQIDYGHPAHEIMVFSEREDVDLIAMSSHGRSGLQRLAMGSVAEGVLRHATKPLFVIRAVL
jgi:nucleotide-binding universal stress UspA family protein